MTNEPTPFQFHAFISYKRGGNDEKYAKWLQKRLEAYRIPVELASSFPGLSEDKSAKRFKVFRDKTDLGSYANLSSGLTQSLSRCRFLLVVCSPRCAESPYVDDEVRYFLENGRGEYIIPFIIAGSPAPGKGEEQCYPPSLTPDALGVTLAEGSREEALLKIVARLLQVEFPQVYQRHLRAQRRFMARAMAAVLAVLTLVSALAVWAVLAEQQATAQRKEAEGLIRFLTFDLRDEAFNHIPLRAREKITDKVETYYTKWGEQGEDSRYYRAVHLSNQAAVLLDSGYGNQALELARQAQGLLEGLREKKPDDPALRFTRLEVNSVLTRVRHNMLDNTDAVSTSLEDMTLAKQLLEASPDSEPVRRLYVRVFRDAAKEERLAGRPGKAEELLQHTIDISRAWVERDGGGHAFTAMLSESLSAMCLFKTDARQHWLAACREARETAERWNAADPYNFNAQSALRNAYDSMLYAQVTSSRVEEAESTYTKVQPLHEQACANDPDNLLWKLQRVYVELMHLEVLIQMSNDQGMVPDEKLFQSGLAEANSLYGQGVKRYGSNDHLSRLSNRIYAVKTRYNDVHALRSKQQELERFVAETRQRYEAVKNDSLAPEAKKIVALNEFSRFLEMAAAVMSSNARHKEALDYIRERLNLEDTVTTEQAVQERNFFSYRSRMLANCAKIAFNSGDARLGLFCLSEAHKRLLAADELNEAPLSRYVARGNFYSALVDVSLTMGCSQAALAAAEEMLRYRELALADPGSGPQQEQAVLFALEKLALTMWNCGLYTQAEPVYDLLFKKAQELTDNPKAAHITPSNLVQGRLLSYFATHLNDLGDRQQAEATIAKAEQVLGDAPKKMERNWRLSTFALFARRARMLLEDGEPRQAIELVQKSLNDATFSHEEIVEWSVYFAPLLDMPGILFEACMQLNMEQEAEAALLMARDALERSGNPAGHAQTPISNAHCLTMEARLALLRRELSTAAEKSRQAVRGFEEHVSFLAREQNVSEAQAEERLTLCEWKDARARAHLLAGTVERTLGNGTQARLFLKRALDDAEYLHKLEPRQQYWRGLYESVNAELKITQ